MLKRTSLLIIVTSLSALVQAQKPLTKDEEKVQQTIIDFFESLSNRDSLSLKSYSSIDITLFEYGRVWTLDTLIRRAIKLNTVADFKRVNSIEFINSSVDKNSAWATYHLQSVITKDGKQATVQWLETVVLVKDRKRWKVKQLHSTLIKRS